MGRHYKSEYAGPTIHLPDNSLSGNDLHRVRKSSITLIVNPFEFNHDIPAYYAILPKHADPEAITAREIGNIRPCYGNNVPRIETEGTIKFLSRDIMVLTDAEAERFMRGLPEMGKNARMYARILTARMRRMMEEECEEGVSGPAFSRRAFQESP